MNYTGAIAMARRLSAISAILALCLLSAHSSAQSPQPQPSTPVDVARAEIARGRYADAEALLAPPAVANPGGAAALELGLLQQYLGRRTEATQTLVRLIDRLTPSTADD